MSGRAQAPFLARSCATFARDVAEMELFGVGRGPMKDIPREGMPGLIESAHGGIQDHSLVGQWVAEGRLSPEQARFHPRRNALLQALGASEQITPEIHTRMLAQGDHVLLCSDGRWSALMDATIRSTIGGEEAIRPKALHLLEQVQKVGGKDNITLVLCRHGPATV